MVVGGNVAFFLKVIKGFVAERLACGLDVFSRNHLRLSLRRNYVRSGIGELGAGAGGLQVHQLVAALRPLSGGVLVL